MKYPYQNPDLLIEERLDDLLSRMTLKEKIAQLLTMKGYSMYERIGDRLVITDELKKLYADFPGAGLGSWNRADWYSGRNWKTGATPEMLPKLHNMLQKYAVEETRLGIPLQLGGGSIHGIFALGGMVLPTGIGLASTWNRELVRKGFEAVAEEAICVSRNGATASGPTQDVARDPRWSRVEETWGEDPFLSAEMSTEFCRGMLARREQGKDCVFPAIRHFLAYGEPEGGKNSAPAHCGINELYNVHLLPYYYAIKAGGFNLMTSYNLVDGIPCTISPLIENVLRKQWGWKGTCIADAGAIQALTGRFAKDLGEAAAMAVKAGQDLCCWEGYAFRDGLEMALQRGDLTEKELDVPVRRNLYWKFANGLFEHPYIEDEGEAARVFSCKAHREVARKLAEESIVLIKNDNEALPLKNVKKVAVIGPNADSMHNQIGDYTAPQRPGDVITVRAGLEAQGLEVVYAKGCGVRSQKKSGFPEAAAAAEASDAVVLVLGGSSVPNMEIAQADNGAALANEVKTDTEQDKDCGEGYDLASLQLSGVQIDLLRELRKTGKKIITVLIVGRPVLLNEICELSDAVLYAWYPGMEGGTAIAETILGKNNPSGRLPISLPRTPGQLPVYYNHLKYQQNYVDCEGSPLYPFGFGMSYTTFSVTNLRAEKERFTLEEGCKIMVDVTNTGKTAGKDVLELYIKDELVSIARPEIELRGFEKVYLEPGETKCVTFRLGEKELAYFNRDLDFAAEPGTFLVSVSDHGPEKEPGIRIELLPSK